MTLDAAVKVRSEDEIVARLRVLADPQGAERDMFGFRSGVLLPFLGWERAREFLKAGTTREVWESSFEDEETAPLALEVPVIYEAMRCYMVFAWGKVRDHRGISANRSVDKIGEWVWLLGDEEALQLFEDAGYAQYGAPQLASACRSFDLPIPEGEDLENMIAGRPCRVGCRDGCGRTGFE